MEAFRQITEPFYEDDRQTSKAVRHLFVVNAKVSRGDANVLTKKALDRLGEFASPRRDDDTLDRLDSVMGRMCMGGALASYVPSPKESRKLESLTRVLGRVEERNVVVRSMLDTYRRILEDQETDGEAKERVLEAAEGVARRDIAAIRRHGTFVNGIVGGHPNARFRESIKRDAPVRVAVFVNKDGTEW